MHENNDQPTTNNHQPSTINHQRIIPVSDLEFDVVDELYFVTSFGQLCQTLRLAETPVKETLRDLVAKGWVKCFDGGTKEVIVSEVNFDEQYAQYHYLATKAGLFAHHSR